MHYTLDDGPDFRRLLNVQFLSGRRWTLVLREALRGIRYAGEPQP